MSSAAHPDPDVGPSHVSDAELESVFAELIERSAPVIELDAAQRRAWVSGILSAWRSDIVSPDPDTTDRQFLGFVQTNGRSLVGDGAAGLIADTCAELLEPRRESTAKVLQSWRVLDARSPAESTLVITLRRDGAEHSVLASLVEGVLVDLHVSGDVTELLGQDLGELATTDPSLSVTDLDAPIALHELVSGWVAGVANAEQIEAEGDHANELHESLLTNQFAVRSDLVALSAADPTLGLFRIRPSTRPAVFFADCTPNEIVEGNQWATEALATALHRYAETLRVDGQRDPRWQDPDRLAEIAIPLQGPLDSLSQRERAAVTYLEWADWVGAIVGIVGADSVRLDGESIVQMINAQPELTSAIQPSDQAYVAFGFDVALAVWSDIGLVEQATVVPGGRAGLVAAARLAWSTQRRAN